MLTSFFHKGQFKGSLGSSLGWGDKTMCALRPFPCLRPPVTPSECAASSFKRTVPGTWSSLESGHRLGFLLKSFAVNAIRWDGIDYDIPSSTPRPIFAIDLKFLVDVVTANGDASTRSLKPRLTTSGERLRSEGWRLEDGLHN